jgi:uncharacterized pyridoxamine 5'-phosphate oxidase family protein
MSETIVYEAAVYSRTISYKNFKGEENSLELHFALDPIQMLEVIASVPVKKVKSGNPARRDEDSQISEEGQLKFMRDIANKAAGFPSNDGESWEPFEDFSNTLAGKAFITKLASSDEDRKEFAEKVILDPFRAFVKFAAADDGNNKAEVAQFQKMLAQFERIFTVATNTGESLEDRKARLAAEMAALDAASDV